MPTYATWDPDNIGGVTLSGGNLVHSNVGSQVSARSNVCVSSGKWYWEILVGSSSPLGPSIGIRRFNNETPDRFYSYRGQDGKKTKSGVNTAYGASFTYLDVISVALDLDAGKIFFAKNGVWQGSGNPVTGVNPAWDSISGSFLAMDGSDDDTYGGASCRANFGALPFTYSVPTGYNEGLYRDSSITYAQYNPLDKGSGSLSQGNRLFSGNNSTGSIRATVGKASGKWYFEATVKSVYLRQNTIGIATSAHSLTSEIGAQSYGYSYRGYTGNSFHSAVSTAYGATFTTGDVVGVAVDLDAGKIWFSKNGVWQGFGDPSTGDSPAYDSITAGTYLPAVYCSANYNNTSYDSVELNCGERPFSYTVPTGFNSGVYATPSAGSIAAELPAFTAQVTSASWITASLPAFLAEVFGGPQINANLPSFQAQMLGGPQINASIPLFRAIITGYDANVHVSGTVTIPAFRAALSATVSSVSPQPTVELLGAFPAIVGKLFGGGITRLNLSFSSFASTGRIGISGSLSAPLSISLSASSSIAISGSLSAMLNALALSPTGLTGILGNSTLLVAPSASATGLVGLLGNLSLTISRSSDLFSAAISPHGDGTFSLHIGFGATGTYQSSFRSMVLNLKNNGLTEYLNYNFNSMTTFNGSAFGANSNGIYELTGTTDAGSNISWRVRYPRLDLETDDVRKLLRYAWLGVNASGDLILSVILPNGTTYDYTVEQISAVDDGIRVKFGKGIKSRYVSLELKNAANESMILDKMRIFVEPTGDRR